jgi:hypothetical protein
MRKPRYGGASLRWVGDEVPGPEGVVTKTVTRAGI